MMVSTDAVLSQLLGYSPAKVIPISSSNNQIYLVEGVAEEKFILKCFELDRYGEYER